MRCQYDYHYLDKKDQVTTLMLRTGNNRRNAHNTVQTKSCCLSHVLLWTWQPNSWTSPTIMSSPGTEKSVVASEDLDTNEIKLIRRDYPVLLFCCYTCIRLCSPGFLLKIVRRHTSITCKQIYHSSLTAINVPKWSLLFSFGWIRSNEKMYL
jgi:hypothetical protein